MTEFTETESMTGKRKLLVVEDNEINRELLHEFLADDYDLLEAENGQEGLELLQEHYQEISLILLDLEMPVMDGFEFLKIVNADSILKLIPVVIETGSTSSDVEEKCLALGAVDFISKPYNVNIILSRIRNIIRLRETTAVMSAIEYDELTGVYTRQAFCHHAGLLLKQNPDRHYTLVISSIDDFRLIHEKYGEEYTNRMLLHGVSFLRPLIKQGLPVGRYDSELFVTLMEDQSDNMNEAFLKSMLEEIRTGMPVEGVEMRLGIYPDVDHDLPVSTLCERALLAVRSISHQFGKYFAFYDDALRRKQERERKLEQGMRAAFYEKQFRVYYQPKHDTQTGKLIGAEALIRWQHPEFGLIPPSDFIPLFEKTGFVYYADFYAWCRTCENLRRWIDRGLPVVPISVNTSKEDYEYPDYIGMVMNPVRKFQIDPSLLHLEVTESLFSVNPERMAALLSACRDNGFRVELDDFGTGYSSLNLLGTLPLDVVKLDMSFMRELNNGKKARVLSSCITLARSLGLKTVAEGVEAEEQRDLLKSLRCDAIQGYYFSKPIPEEEFEEYMLRCAREEQTEKASAEKYSPESGMYVIDEDYNVVLVNNVIREQFPQMKAGQKCYRCLMGLDKPCDICPVLNKVRGPQTYLDPLRNLYETVQVAEMPLADGRKGHALVFYTLGSEKS